MEYHKILKIFEKIIVNLIIIVLSIIAMFVIWGFVQLNVQKKEYLNIFGYSLFSTETGSMSPTMEKGDIVIIKIGDEIREKDIITYKKENVFITHRIEQIEGDFIIAKGDNNNTEDDPIKKDDVIGKAVYIINNVEIWKKVFSDKNVIIPICITVVLFVLLISYKEKTDSELKKMASKVDVSEELDEKKSTAKDKKTGDKDD